MYIEANLGKYTGMTQAQILEAQAIERTQYKAAIAKSVQTAKRYYDVSSKALDIADITGTTKEMYLEAQKAAPKTVLESAQVMVNFAQKAVAQVQPQIAGIGEPQPMALSLLAEVARGALQAAKSPTGQALITGVTGALGVSGAGIAGAQAKVAGKVQYTVIRDKGRLLDLRTGRTIGYTPREAKKRFKTKRRRKRLTQKDRYEWEMRLAIAQIQAGQPALPPK